MNGCASNFGPLLFIDRMVSNDAGSYTLVKAEATAGGAEGQPLQGYSSQRQLSTKVSGPTLAAASTPGRRVESSGSACEIHPLKIQKSLNLKNCTTILPSLKIKGTDARPIS